MSANRCQDQSYKLSIWIKMKQVYKCLFFAWYKTQGQHRTTNVWQCFIHFHPYPFLLCVGQAMDCCPDCCNPCSSTCFFFTCSLSLCPNCCSRDMPSVKHLKWHENDLRNGNISVAVRNGFHRQFFSKASFINALAAGANGASDRAVSLLQPEQNGQCPQQKRQSSQLDLLSFMGRGGRVEKK